ncbi:hypothetical protein [Streptomyces sp. ISL-94]|uniref:hypothetical protein n=1 Tax=Streptomyces sp. ISL-94 TaxID=2819190 RepID=UPI001BE64EFC|nr:hypothetical protein [Streptomyces sp. ISL-94]MBT2478139.1 hypothetical protein [Streptomyces sp. ISL-94]
MGRDEGEGRPGLYWNTFQNDLRFQGFWKASIRVFEAISVQAGNHSRPCFPVGRHQFP